MVTYVLITNLGHTKLISIFGSGVFYENPENISQLNAMRLYSHNTSLNFVWSLVRCFSYVFEHTAYCWTNSTDCVLTSVNCICTLHLGRRYLSTVEQKLTIGWWRPYYLILLLLSIFISSYLMDGNTKYLAVHFLFQVASSAHTISPIHSPSLEAVTLYIHVCSWRMGICETMGTYSAGNGSFAILIWTLSCTIRWYFAYVCVYLCSRCAHMRWLELTNTCFCYFSISFVLFSSITKLCSWRYGEIGSSNLW